MTRQEFIDRWWLYAREGEPQTFHADLNALLESERTEARAAWDPVIRAALAWYYDWGAEPGESARCQELQAAVCALPPEHRPAP